MQHEEQSYADVRRGLVGGRNEAVETVRDWIAALAYAAHWRLDDTEAAIQEVVLRLLHLARSGRVRENTSFRSFVMTIARHTFTDIYRRQRLRNRIEQPVAAVDRHAVQSSTQQAELESRERRELLRFIYQELGEDCRKMWRLIYGDGLSASQVGERLGISPGNARVRAHRCLQQARQIHDRFAAAPASGGSDG